MGLKATITAALLFLACAQLAPGQDLPTFMGSKVTIIQPTLNADGFPTVPDAHATVCVEASPQRQCYTAPQGFWYNPTVSVVQLRKDLIALLFSVENYTAGSGWQIHFAILRPGMGKDLDDAFMSDPTVSNQSQHVFWSDPAVSDAMLFVTADYVWGPDEGHYGSHRYIVSAYLVKSSLIVGDPYYHLEDRYMTIRKYDLDAEPDILTSEKSEILARLRQIKAENPQ